MGWSESVAQECSVADMYPNVSSESNAAPYDFRQDLRGSSGPHCHYI